ncbi:MAG: hypothetical protein KF819_31695 [Labilithrix sp.]|nr:hypothetical protein [Labilithrix sp.]
MTVRRSFRRSGDTLVDVYGRNVAGKPVSFQAPVAALKELRWGPHASAERSPDPAALRRDRDALRATLRDAALSEFTTRDVLDVARLADRESARLLESRFVEMTMAWKQSDPGLLARAAASILVMNPCHLEAVRSLSEDLFAGHLSDYARASVADSISAAFDPHLETEAMFELREALMRLARASDGVVWGPFAYTCVGPMLGLARDRMLTKCDTELRQQDEWNRSLLINELAEVPGADLLVMLRRHAKREPSARVRIRLMRLLGGLVAPRSREEILARGLQDESPSCRYLAIKALHRLPRKVAHELASGNVAVEPDVHLRDLLEQVLAATR